MPWTTDDLVARARRKAQWPSAAKLTDPQILEVADEELQSFVVPQVRAAAVGFWIKEAWQSLTDGISHYTIPDRASIGSVYEIDLVYGPPAAPSRVVPLAQIDQSRRYALGYDGTFSGGPPAAFAIEDDAIIIFPTPAPGTSANASLRIRYERRPSQLVPTSQCAQVTAIALSSVTSAVSLGPSPQTLDLVKSLPNFTALLDSCSFTITGTGPYVYVSPLLQGVPQSVGDWLCPERKTCVSPVPDIWFWFLIDRTAAGMLSEAGDEQQAQAIRASSMDKLGKALSVATRRVKTQAKVVMPLGTPLRAPAGGWRR